MTVKSYSPKHHILQFTLATSAILGISAIAPSQVMAIGFTGAYAPTNWGNLGAVTFTGSNTDGSIDTSNATTRTVILTGGDNTSGNPGTTDWTITIADTGTLSFNWSFTTPQDSPFGDDSAGFLLNGAFSQLATDSGVNDISLASGTPINGSTIFIPVVAGDTFGFRVDTSTNGGTPGIFTVTSFDIQPVPFEFEGSAGILTLGAIWGANQWRKNRTKK